MWPSRMARTASAIGFHQPLEEFLGQYKTESAGLLEGYQRLEQILANPAAPPGTPAGAKA